MRGLAASPGISTRHAFFLLGVIGFTCCCRPAPSLQHIGISFGFTCCYNEGCTYCRGAIMKSRETNYRELLEPAAKAVGFRIKISGSGDVYIQNGINTRAWNPLSDDGDALRLAVKLGIRIWGPGHAVTPDGRPCIEGVGDNEEANTRRAIVRAAAQVGQAMS